MLSLLSSCRLGTQLHVCRCKPCVVAHIAQVCSTSAAGAAVPIWSPAKKKLRSSALSDSHGRCASGGMICNSPSGPRPKKSPLGVITPWYRRSWTFEVRMSKFDLQVLHSKTFSILGLLALEIKENEEWTGTVS